MNWCVASIPQKWECRMIQRNEKSHEKSVSFRIMHNDRRSTHGTYFRAMQMHNERTNK